MRKPRFVPTLLVTLACEELWCIGDLAHFEAVQLARPEVSVSFDADGEKAVSARKDLFRLAADAQVVLAGAHLPRLVRLEPKGEGFVARPAARR